MKLSKVLAAGTAAVGLAAVTGAISLAAITGPVTPAVADDTAEIAGALGLPDYNPGSLSDEQTRAVYIQGEVRMRKLDEQLARDGVDSAARAQIMIDQRNALRAWARSLMSNRTLAEELDAKDPNRTFDDPITNGLAAGLSGDNFYGAVIDSATRSRASVNESLGIDPANPPELPPVLPSHPFYGGEPVPADP